MQALVQMKSITGDPAHFLGLLAGGTQDSTSDTSTSPLGSHSFKPDVRKMNLKRSEWAWNTKKDPLSTAGTLWLTMTQAPRLALIPARSLKLRVLPTCGESVAGGGSDNSDLG